MGRAGYMLGKLAKPVLYSLGDKLQAVNVFAWGQIASSQSRAFYAPEKAWAIIHIVRFIPEYDEIFGVNQAHSRYEELLLCNNLSVVQPLPWSAFAVWTKIMQRLTSAFPNNTQERYGIVTQGQAEEVA